MGYGESIPSGALALRAEMQGNPAKEVGQIKFGDRCASIRLGNDSLWAIVGGDETAGYAIRCAWSPGGSLELRSSKEGMFELVCSIGKYSVRIDAPSASSILHVTAKLTPSADVTVPWWPRDLYPLGENYDPGAAKGEVFASQRGLNTALVYGQLEGPDEGTFFYLQDLTSLNDYYNMSGTKPDGVVGGEWPELGYQVPPPAEQPLKKDQEITISDAFLSVSRGKDHDERIEARLFLEHLAAIYPHIQRPPVQFYDWPSKAELTVRDLAESPLATVRDGGYLYARPYVDAEVPDSMVQAALTMMVFEHAAWEGKPSSLGDELSKGIYRFFAPEVGAVRRYLNTVGPNKDPDEVDSWYLYHPLKSLAWLARKNNDGAKEIFLASLDYAVRVAQHFHYSWPVQFSLSTLKITNEEREPGGPGQTDAGGLYAYVMIDAYEMTGDKRYLKEAQNAIRATKNMNFELAYQTNLTSWGATACLRLWKITGERFFLDQASVFLASFFHNCTMWDARIGKVSETTTFFGVTCLHDAPYLAPYECYESFWAFVDCLAMANEDLSEGLRLLLTEFIRYAPDRAWWFYPSSLRESSIAHSPRNGQNVRALAFPLEDLYVDGQPAGQVGQEVYGSGLGLAITTRCFHRLEGGRMLFCEYPLREFKRTDHGCTFTVHGAEGWKCGARILYGDGVQVKIDGKKADYESFEVPVGAKVEIRWELKEKPARTNGKSKAGKAIAR